MPEQTMAFPSGGAKRSPKTERRTGERSPCNAEVSFQLLPAHTHSAWYPARVRNIAVGNIGLAMDSAVQPGAILWVKLEGTDPRFTRPLLVRVARVSQQASGHWHIGGTFVVPLTEEQLQAVLLAAQPRQALQGQGEGSPGSSGNQPFLNGTTKERRTSPRRRVTIPVFLSCDNLKVSSFAAQAIDFSRAGLGLLASRPFARGTVLQVRPTHAPRKIPWVKVRVMCCRPQQRQFIVGVRFLFPPSADVLLAFG